MECRTARASGRPSTAPKKLGRSSISWTSSSVASSPAPRSDTGVLIMKKVELITDGSCLGNPGPGGWACILRFGAQKKELFGFDPRTTNNRMELMAAIQGLLALKGPCEVEITTDAEYALHGITRWILKWKQRHWWRKHEP